MTDAPSIFTPTPAGENTEVTLIGEGKKYKDLAAADKALRDKDAFIESLKREAAEARQEAQKRMSLEEFWQKTQEAKKEVPASISTPVTPIQEEREENNKNEPQDIAALVREALAMELTKAKQTQNLGTVRNELEKVWGPNYVETLKQKTVELGLGTDFVDSIAARSPTAFLALVGANTQASAPVAPNAQVPPMSSNRTVFNTSSNEDRNQAYYDKLKKEDPKRYFSVPVQLQRHKDALAMGEKFFS